jgi:hypothetical protein
VLILTGCDKADDADFVGAQKRAAGLVIGNAPPCVALHGLDQTGKAGEGVASVSIAKLPCKFVPDQCPVIAGILLETQHPSTKSPDNEAFGGGEFSG